MQNATPTLLGKPSWIEPLVSLLEVPQGSQPEQP